LLAADKRGLLEKETIFIMKRRDFDRTFENRPPPGFFIVIIAIVALIMFLVIYIVMG
jgi:hypothetical protein